MEKHPQEKKNNNKRKSRIEFFVIKRTLVFGDSIYSGGHNCSLVVWEKRRKYVLFHIRYMKGWETDCEVCENVMYIKIK